MPSLEDHFRALTKIHPPDRWPDLDSSMPTTAPHPRALVGRIGVVVLALLIAAGGSFVLVRAFQRPTSSVGEHPQVRHTPSTSSIETTPSPSPSHTSPRVEHGMFGTMLDAIRASSPPGWRFELRGDRLDGDWTLDGEVEDGSGPGRLYVNVTVRPNMLTPHPCGDSEFRRGAPCVERPLADGDLLVLRDVVADPGGTKTIEVVLIHPDGSGIGAEAGNFTITPLGSHTTSTEAALSTPRVTRPQPLYTVGQLGRLVRAVDESVAAYLLHVPA
jgi:hypothetical protein